MYRRPNWLIALTLVAVPAFFWTANPAAAQADAQQRVGEYDISSFIGEDVRAVTHIDLKKIDLDRTQAWAERLVENIDANGTERQQAMARLGRQFGQFEAWANYMKEAGANQVYILSTVRDDKAVPIFVVPGIDQEQLQTVKTLVTPIEKQRDHHDRMQAAYIRNAVVVAPAELIQQLQQPQAPREHAQFLLSGLQEVEGAAIRVSCWPDRDGRKAMRDMGRAFDDAQFDGVRSIAIGIDYPEKDDRGFKMIMSAEDSQTAERVKQRWNEKLQQAADADDAQLAAARIAEHRDALEAEVEDTRVVITLSNEQANKVLKDVMLPIVKAEREQRNRGN